MVAVDGGLRPKKTPVNPFMESTGVHFFMVELVGIEPATS